MPKAKQETETIIKTPISTRIAKALLLIFAGVIFLSVVLILRILATNIR